MCVRVCVCAELCVYVYMYAYELVCELIISYTKIFSSTSVKIRKQVSLD